MRIALLGSGDTARVLLALIQEKNVPIPDWYGYQLEEKDYVTKGLIEQKVPASSFNKKTYESIPDVDSRYDICIVNYPSDVTSYKLPEILGLFQSAPKNIIVLFCQGTTLYEISKIYQQYPDTNFMFSDGNITNVKYDTEQKSLNVTKLIKVMRLYSNKQEIPDVVRNFFQFLKMGVKELFNPFYMVLGLSNMIVHSAVWSAKFERGMLINNDPLYGNIPNLAYEFAIRYYLERYEIQKELFKRGVFTGKKSLPRPFPKWFAYSCLGLTKIVPEYFVVNVLAIKQTFPLQQEMSAETFQKHFSRDFIYGLTFFQTIAKHCSIKSELYERVQADFMKIDQFFGTHLFETQQEKIRKVQEYFKDEREMIEKSLML